MPEVTSGGVRRRKKEVLVCRFSAGTLTSCHVCGVASSPENGRLAHSLYIVVIGLDRALPTLSSRLVHWTACLCILNIFIFFPLSRQPWNVSSELHDTATRCKALKQVQHWHWITLKAYNQLVLINQLFLIAYAKILVHPGGHGPKTGRSAIEEEK